MATKIPAKVERVRKTPAEKAAHALGVERRRHDALVAKRDALTTEAAALDGQIKASAARFAYLLANPDLPEQDTDPIPGIDEQGPLDDATQPE